MLIPLFVSAFLGILDMPGLLNPLSAMATRSLDFLPNVVAVLVVGGVGWIVAAVSRKLTPSFNFADDILLGSLILVIGFWLANLVF